MKKKSPTKKRRRKIRIGFDRKIYSRPVFERMIKRLFNKYDVQDIMFSYRQSKHGHRGQTRLDLSRTFDHSKGAALIILLEFKIYLVYLIIAALLHDVMEDSFLFTWPDIRKHFGQRVFRALFILTKTDKRKYFVRLTKASWWILLIKFADRLHNLRTLIKTDDRAFIKKQLKETQTCVLPLIPIFRKKTPHQHRWLADYILDEMSYAMAKAEKYLKKTREQS